MKIETIGTKYCDKGWTLEDNQNNEEYDDPHMVVGLQDGSSSSMPSNMLSMEEDLVDMRRPHGVQGSRLPRDDNFLLPC